MKSVCVDMTNQRFEMFTVIQRHGSNKHKSATWLCRCDCGNEFIATGQDLRRGDYKSCGCFQHSKSENNSNYKHGCCAGKTTPTYSSWSSMKKRCSNINNKDYHRYGGSGITFNEEWSVFSNFLRDMGEKPEGYELDRIDGTKGYYKENCRWATRQQQNDNRKNVTHYILYDTFKINLNYLCEYFNVSYGAGKYRKNDINKVRQLCNLTPYELRGFYD